MPYFYWFIRVLQLREIQRDWPKIRRWRAKNPAPTYPVGAMETAGTPQAKLLQLCQARLDRLEIRHQAGIIVALRIANDTLFVDDECRALGDAAHAEIFLRQETVIRDAVRLRDLVLVVGQQRDGDLFLLRPGGLRERIVAADAEHVGVQAGVGVQALAHPAHFLRAPAGKGHREKQEDCVLLTTVAAEPDLLRTLRGLRGQFKIRCLVANFQCHGDFSFKCSRGPPCSESPPSPPLRFERRMVDDTGLEPVASSMSRKRSSQLS